jgi:hypothetical protein
MAIIINKNVQAANCITTTITSASHDQYLSYQNILFIWVKLKRQSHEQVYILEQEE